MGRASHTHDRGPGDPGELAFLVQNLIVHRGEGERFGCAIPEERLREDAESRYVSLILRIRRERRDAPLTEPRAPGDRFVGTCRDFSLLHCSLLRATGTPARIRRGFATYFLDDWHEDHWVTEYRLPDGSWRLIDPQVLHPPYNLTFDPTGVRRSPTTRRSRRRTLTLVDAVVAAGSAVTLR
ncbi:transglutaminase domain-containing protein [Streptomyces sp. ISL-14]|nr:transglutaminase domain-containing protein [Streptomyces sp. ISL-14]